MPRDVRGKQRALLSEHDAKMAADLGVSEVTAGRTRWRPAKNEILLGCGH